MQFLCSSASEKNIFLCFLCSLLEKIEQETWRETGISFVTSVTRLVERLLDYRYTPIIKMHILNLLVYVSKLQYLNKALFLGTA